MIREPADGLINTIDAPPTHTEQVDSDHTARVDASDPLRAALTRALARAGWLVIDANEPAEVVIRATDAELVTVRSGIRTANTGLVELPALLRGWQSSGLRCAAEHATTAALAELSSISPYFAVASGPLTTGDWYPVDMLYTDRARLADVVDRVAARMGVTEMRVAASTFFLGFAARLWSIGLGGLADHRLLIDLTPEHLWYHPSDGTVRLHLPDPIAWQGERLESRLADLILEAHLRPLSAAVRRLCPISEKLLWGNAASTVLAAARALNRHHGAALVAEPSWPLARTICGDERLTDTVRFTDAATNYRRTTCCLFYRSPGAGLCADCALTHKPAARPQQNTNRKEAG